MRGRPRKMFFEGEQPITTTIRISEKDRQILPEGFNLSAFVSEMIRAKWEDKDQASMEELLKEKSELENKLAIITLKINELKNKIEEKNRIEKTIQTNRKFSIYMVRHFMNLAKQERRPLIPVSTFHGLGIDLDYKKLSEEVRQGKKELFQMGDDELYEYLHILYHPSSKDNMRILRDRLFEEFLKVIQNE